MQLPVHVLKKELQLYLGMKQPSNWMALACYLDGEI